MSQPISVIDTALPASQRGSVRAAAADLEGVLRELAPGEGLYAERVAVALERSRAVDGEADRQDDDQAGARQAARALRHARHVPQRAELDEGACSGGSSAHPALRQTHQVAMQCSAPPQRCFPSRCLTPASTRHDGLDLMKGPVQAARNQLPVGRQAVPPHKLPTPPVSQDMRCILCLSICHACLDAPPRTYPAQHPPPVGARELHAIVTIETAKSPQNSLGLSPNS